MSDTTMTIEQVILRLARMKLAGQVEDIARLLLIKANPEWRHPRVIAANFGTNGANMCRFQAKMVKRGFLKAERLKTDRRQVSVTVTAAGSNFLRKIERDWSKGA
jgi:DNA-binding MarR family transcriptional regulator